MQEFFRSLPPVEILSHLVCLVIVVLAFLTFLIVWVPVQWRLHRRTELEAALKQDMLNRGMSAEEIERVLKTSLPEGAEPPVTADVGRSARRVPNVKREDGIRTAEGATAKSIASTHAES